MTVPNQCVINQHIFIKKNAVDGEIGVYDVAFEKLHYSIDVLKEGL